MNIAELPRDVVIYMATKLNLPELYNLCLTNSKFNKLICSNEMFWMNKLINDIKFI